MSVIQTFLSNMLTLEISEKIRDCGVIAVIAIDDAKDALPMASALQKGGISVIELTLRTPAAIDSIQIISEELPAITIGAGTVLTCDQANQALSAGAQFAVAPGLNPKVVRHCQSIGLPFAPGVMTPSDIELSIELGCKTMKLFPAESIGGINTLNTMSAPYRHLGIKFIPLGGLNQNNMGTYLQSPLVEAIGGSWIAKQETISAKDWNAIEASALAASSVVKKLRK
ncbi:bifunctional 4-hydroxy-2-oxoglutarate aldolase/2-dehydro-3-deoxy-phosphogluconate aldolase [Pelagicoccus sp. SDUM812003]|uniref:bifunctional 4-hydroxy-2-oxoglutarate aldolase/2-dehydro-3-deoxy-phosphogluconate aldolase n=1 Tax=Pelagicoccus sp. SDUM812003 TaxID=3041267 RepID=UPI00280FCF16|nr:bifunctional 4-hydroxy-2-oxoglutarate aldolase/2-dehydro-3-deoxy-phosphogluconate aldolase [Pelagicoccus sp. SDUM812003]MDQ8201464.1 bifunctional 4-hydroxy-2-oxoglutarate aldolase/2-dehydro-3-deoxy-phosphogluconate aldolase [Pelagicoccus sp. SDUM812003]